MLKSAGGFLFPRDRLTVSYLKFSVNSGCFLCYTYLMERNRKKDAWASKIDNFGREMYV